MIPLQARQSEAQLKSYCFGYVDERGGVVEDRDILIGLHSLGYTWDWDEGSQKIRNIMPGPAEMSSVASIEDCVEETMDLSVPGSHSYVVNGLVSHNTANLPKGYTFEQYKNLFNYAYEKGLKGFTTFNPQGSMKGVLESKKEEKLDSFIIRSDAPKRPNELPCDIHYVHANNQDFIILAGLLNGSVYEIFVDEQNGHDLGTAKAGKIVKKGKGEYSLADTEGKILVEGLSKNFTGTYGSLARMISMSLRHGVPLQFWRQPRSSGGE